MIPPSSIVARFKIDAGPAEKTRITKIKVTWAAGSTKNIKAAVVSNCLAVSST